MDQAKSTMLFAVKKMLHGKYLLWGGKLGVVGQEESNGLAGEQCISAKRSNHFQPLMLKSDQKMTINQTKKRNILDLFLLKKNRI